MPVSNNSNMSLPLSIFMVHNDYDLIKGADYISATSLLKPIKSTILGGRIKGSAMDTLDMVASAVGTASHDRLEKAFLNGNHVTNMKKLGYPEEVIKNVLINPKGVEPGDFPIYLERRSIKPLNGWRIGGKFDFVAEGIVRDLKTTKVFKWMKGDFEEYILQGSIYRWLNQDIITEDYMYIDFIFTDWKAYEYESKEGYPKYPAISKAMDLMTVEETEAWLSTRLSLLETYADAEQGDIPNCTQYELWQSDPVYKYFKNPKGKRATKNFKDFAEANQRLLNDGAVGIVKTVLGEPKRCGYCSANPICEQYASMVKKGLITL